MASQDDSVISVDGVTVDSTSTENNPVNQDIVKVNEQVNSEEIDKKISRHTSESPTVTLQIQGEVNNSSSTSSARRHHSSSSSRSRSASLKQDNSPPLDEKSVLLAATLVQDAKSGRNLTFRMEEKYVRSYILYHKWYLQYLLYFFIIFDLCLALFEKPAVKGASLPYWATMLMEAVCLVFFALRQLHAFHFQETMVFFRDTKNYMIIGTIVLTVIDMVAYIAWINQAPDKNPVRWSRPLRPLFIINFSDGKQVRRAFRNIRRTVPDIMHVLILFICSVLLFGLLALKLFYKREFLVYPDGEPYFKSYADSVWDMYVLVTTANSPDVMMPAYDYNNWYMIYFQVFIVINLYIFMSIVLATIYYNYKKNLKNEIKTAVYSKRQKLVKAFDILKINYNGKWVITPTRWLQLMRVVMPLKSSAQVELLLKVLDISGDGYIYKEEFLNLSDLLQVKLTEVKDRQTVLEKLLPSVYNSPVSVFIRDVVRHRFFRHAFDFLIFINAFFIGFDVDEADWFFLVVFSIEIVLKLYVLGPYQFVMHFWNIFDFCVIGAAVIATLIEAITGETSAQSSTLDILLVLRVLRLFKLFASIKRFKIVIQTIMNIGPSVSTYGGVIFVFYYSFAIIGMELFQGLISYHGYSENTTAPENLWCGASVLQNTTFYHLHYCSNNFNTIAKAFILLMELTVVNQWNGFVFVTSKAARIYFFVFHMCCVVLVLNIFTAFILEAFILEYSLRMAPKLEFTVEAKIKQLGLGIGMKPKQISPPSGDELELVSEEQLPAQEIQPDEHSDSDSDSEKDLAEESGLRFHLKKRNRKKTEVLLQQMFQSEIDAEDTGPAELDEETELKQTHRRLTLDAVT